MYYNKQTMDYECDVCMSPYIGLPCSICEKSVCRRCVGDILKLSSYLDLGPIYCSQNCLYDHILDLANKVNIQHQLNVFKFISINIPNLLVYSNVIFRDQEDKYSLVLLSNKKWIAWTRTYMTKHLIKDIANIVMSY